MPAPISETEDVGTESDVSTTSTKVPCGEFVSNVRPAAEQIVHDGKTHTIRRGEYGFFRGCGSNSQPCQNDPNYLPTEVCGNSDIGFCTKVYPDTPTLCPSDNGIVLECGWSDSAGRRFACQRDNSNFLTEIQGNTWQTCCGLPQSEARKQDCPYFAHINSAWCEDGTIGALFESCIDVNNPNRDPLGPGCHLLVTQLPEDHPFDAVRQMYITEMLTACRRPGTIGHPACVKLMRENAIDASPLRAYLHNFCTTETTPDDMAYRSICACFYADSFYDNIRNSLAERYNFPAEFMNGGRKCYFPACANSPLNDDPSSPRCPDMNLTTCIQTINFTGTGRITDVTFNQEQHCGDIQRRDICDPACEAPKVCMAGNVCADPERCTQDADCGPNGTMSCEDGVCVDKPQKYWPIILGILLGLLALGVGGFVFWKWRKNKASTSAESSSE